MQLLGISKHKIMKDENGENVAHLEITEIVLVHCNIVNSNCQQYLGMLYKFLLNKSFYQSLDNSSKNFIFCKSL